MRFLGNLFGKDANTYFNAGFRYFKQKRYDQAKIEFNNALEINPNHWKSLVCLGQILCGEGNDREAIRVLERAASLHEADAELYHLLGCSYGCLNQFQKAIEAFKQAVKRAPKHLLAHGALILAYGEAGQYENARRAIDPFLSLKPPNEQLNDVILWLGKQFIESPHVWRTYNLVDSIFQLVKLLDGTSIDSQGVSTGGALVSKGLRLKMSLTRKEELPKLLPYFLAAFEILKDANDAQREVARCLQNIGWICLNVGWFEHALKLSQEALDRFHSIPDSTGDQAVCKETIGAAYGHLGESHAEKKWKLEAIDAFLQAGPKQWRRESARDLPLYFDEQT